MGLTGEGLGITPPREWMLQPTVVPRKPRPPWAETPGDLVRVSPLPWHFLIRSREAPTRVLLLPWGCTGDRQLKALEAWVEESECPGSSLPLCLAAVDGGP